MLFCCVVPMVLMASGCHTSPDMTQALSVAQKSAGVAKKVGDVRSVVPPAAEQKRGLSKVRTIKNDAEALAGDAPETAARSYKLLASAIDTWIEEKSEEADRLGTRLTGYVDLSEESAAAVVEAFAAFKEAIGMSRGTNESAAVGAFIGVIGGAVKPWRQTREGSAVAFKTDLAKLKMRSWSEVRS